MLRAKRNWLAIKPRKAPAAIMARSRPATFSRGRKKLAVQKITAADKALRSVYPMGSSQELRSSYVTGMLSPKKRFERKAAI